MGIVRTAVATSSTLVEFVYWFDYSSGMRLFMPCSSMVCSCLTLQSPALCFSAPCHCRHWLRAPKPCCSSLPMHRLLIPCSSSLAHPWPSPVDSLLIPRPSPAQPLLIPCSFPAHPLPIPALIPAHPQLIPGPFLANPLQLCKWAVLWVTMLCVVCSRACLCFDPLLHKWLSFVN